MFVSVKLFVGNLQLANDFGKGRKMDCDRIYMLLNKYWGCSTTIDEERELRHFFTNNAIPSELRPYKVWFSTPEAEKLPLLGDEFDQKILKRITGMKKKRRYRLILWACLILAFLCSSVLILYLYSFFYCG